MISILSSSKSLDFNDDYKKTKVTTPTFIEKSLHLREICNKLSVNHLQKIMGISKTLAELNFKRFQHFNIQPKKQAIFAYDGEVYSHIKRSNLSLKQIDFIQKHILIISGLYGALKPLDEIQAYRLEMSTKFPDIKNLADFWKSDITNYINNELSTHKNKYLINLASKEYSSVVNKEALNFPFITINFKEKRNDKFQIIGINAKKARGIMTNFILQNEIDSLDEIKCFTQSDYKFEQTLSSDSDWVFICN